MHLCKMHMIYWVSAKIRVWFSVKTQSVKFFLLIDDVIAVFYNLFSTGSITDASSVTLPKRSQFCIEEGRKMVFDSFQRCKFFPIQIILQWSKQVIVWWCDIRRIRWVWYLISILLVYVKSVLQCGFVVKTIPLRLIKIGRFSWIAI